MIAQYKALDPLIYSLFARAKQYTFLLARLSCISYAAKDKVEKKMLAAHKTGNNKLIFGTRYCFASICSWYNARNREAASPAVPSSFRKLKEKMNELRNK